LVDVVYNKIKIKRIYSIYILFIGWLVFNSDVWWVMGGEVENRAKNEQKTSPKNRGPRSPGRGVLQNSAPGYRNPVHILAVFAFFSLFCPI